ncbi:MAG: DUF6785 family protein, partial [Planctomycetota bacterium]
MRRTTAAITVGLAGAVFIWVVTPYNNFVLGNAYISDDYMPPAALFVAMLLVLGVNPLLRRLAPGFSFDARELALIFGILLVACVTPSQGLLRELPYGLAGSVSRVSKSEKLATAYKELDPPASLFPDPLAHGGEPKASTAFLDKLRKGESIPWGNWAGPLFAWLGLLLPWWLMMTALAVIVLPQWRDNERQPFPLLAVQQALVEDPGPGHSFAPIFRNRLFWLAGGAVFLLHFLAGANQYFPGRVPEIALEWRLDRFFTEEPLIHMPWFMKYYRLHFIFLGVAFFMPKRVGFSIWFFQLAYAVYIIVGNAYLPPFYYHTITDHRTGAFFVFPLGVLWLGRRHWAHVFRCVFKGVQTDADRRERIAGIAFIAGCLGMFAWFIWVHVNPLWAAGFVVLAFLYAVAITRAVTETGLPLIAPDTSYTIHLARLVPVAWRTAASMYYSGVVAFLVGHCNRLCVTTMVIHALGLDKKSSPRKHVRVAGLLLGVIVLSLVVCGAVHLVASYNHSMTLDGRIAPISRWGTYQLTGTGDWLLGDWKSPNQPSYSRPFHILFGAVLAGVLQWLCQISPTWPLHPVALLFAGNWYAHRVWFNVFLGWLAKVLILRYGGSRVYNRVVPFFIGIIMGEVLAMAFWTVVSGLVASFGGDYQTVRIL